MAEKSSAQFAKQCSACVEFVKKYKSLKAERLKGFFSMNAQNIFFQLPNLKKDIVRGRRGYCVPGENKTKGYGSSGALQAT